MYRTVQVKNMQDQNRKKRSRSENWLIEDKNLLEQLVMERVDDIENKNTDTNANARKLAAWTDLQKRFNTMSRNKRSISQLRNQWVMAKMRAKKQKMEELMNNESPSKTEPNDISHMLKVECTFSPNESDSEPINQINTMSAATSIIDDDPEESLHEDPLQMPMQYLPKMVPRRNKCKKKYPLSAAEKVAATEIECRKELHRMQMENEKKRAENLELEQVLIKAKIELLYKDTLNIS